MVRHDSFLSSITYVGAAVFICRGNKLDHRELYQTLDWDALYADLGWEPKETVGSEDKGYCLDPWNMHAHGDRTGKLAINREKGVYNCWVCGGGTVLNLVKEVKQLSDDKAGQYLAKFANVGSFSTEEFLEKVQRLLDYEQPVEKPLPKFKESVLDQWTGVDHEWFRERGISSEVRSYFKVGFNPLYRLARADGTYEGPAILLPHFWNDLLVGWQVRWLADDRPSWVPKYTNTTGFPRESSIWGHSFSSRQPEPVVVVESVPTSLFLLSSGIPSVATFGSQLTPIQLRYLRSYQQGVYLAPDNDQAGAKWLETAASYLTRYIKVYEVPPVKGEGADLGDLASDQLSHHLKEATNVI